jgi:hypothetical protein
MLSTNLRLGLPIGLFPSDFFTRHLYALYFVSIRATCPAYLILLDLILIHSYITISATCPLMNLSSFKRSKEEKVFMKFRTELMSIQ